MLPLVLDTWMCAEDCDRLAAPFSFGLTLRSGHNLGGCPTCPDLGDFKQDHLLFEVEFPSPNQLTCIFKLVYKQVDWGRF